MMPLVFAPCIIHQRTGKVNGQKWCRCSCGTVTFVQSNVLLYERSAVNKEASAEFFEKKPRKMMLDAPQNNV
jgi:hypothetical protein